MAQETSSTAISQEEYRRLKQLRSWHNQLENLQRELWQEAGEILDGNLDPHVEPADAGLDIVQAANGVDGYLETENIHIEPQS